MRHFSRILILALTAVFLFSQAAPAAKKRIAISGAWALYPMMVVWAEQYQKTHKDVLVDVSAGGAGKGAADTLAGMVDIGMISREAQPDELDKGGVFTPVAKDAVIAVINSANPAAKQIQKTGLTKEDFQNIWIKAEAKSWDKVVKGSSEPIRAYIRSDACGAAESWAKFLGGKQEDLKGTGVYGDPGLLQAVQKDPLGIGFNNYSYVFDPKTGKPLPGVIVVPIDVNGNGKIDANERINTKELLRKAIKANVYPHPPARPLYLMTKGAPKGEVKKFIKWILTTGQGMVDKAGYLKVPAAEIKKQLKKLEK